MPKSGDRQSFGRRRKRLTLIGFISSIILRLIVCRGGGSKLLMLEAPSSPASTGVWWFMGLDLTMRGVGGAAARAGFGALGGAFLGFLEPIAFAVELDDFAAMVEAVDEGDDSGSVGEHVGPFGEGFVGGDDDVAVEVSVGDDFEVACRRVPEAEETGVSVVSTIWDTRFFVPAGERSYPITQRNALPAVIRAASWPDSSVRGMIASPCSYKRESRFSGKPMSVLRPRRGDEGIRLCVGVS